MREILDAISKMEKRLNERLDRIEEQNREIREAVRRIEEEQPKDITAMLDRIEKKVDGHQAGTKTLNERLFVAELEIMKLKGESI